MKLRSTELAQLNWVDLNGVLSLFMTPLLVGTVAASVRPSWIIVLFVLIGILAGWALAHCVGFVGYKFLMKDDSTLSLIGYMAGPPVVWIGGMMGLMALTEWVVKRII